MRNTRSEKGSSLIKIVVGSALIGALLVGGYCFVRENIKQGMKLYTDPMEYFCGENYSCEER
jgi:hypothetical protein